MNVNETIPTWVSRGNWTCWVCWKYLEIKEYNKSFWDYFFYFGGRETDETINIKEYSYDKEQFAPEKLAVIVKGENAETLH